MLRPGKACIGRGFKPTGRLRNLNSCDLTEVEKKNIVVTLLSERRHYRPKGRRIQNVDTFTMEELLDGTVSYRNIWLILKKSTYFHFSSFRKKTLFAQSSLRFDLTAIGHVKEASN